MTQTEQIISGLQADLRRKATGSVLLAFSGGLGSSVLLLLLKEVCREKGVPVMAVTVQSIFQTRGDRKQLESLAGRAGATLKYFACDPAAMPLNDRKALFAEIIEYAGSEGFGVVMTGACEPVSPSLMVSTPLADAGCSREQLRQLASELGVKYAEWPVG